MQRVQRLRPDWRRGWALGFWIRRVDDQVRIGHTGSLPGHRTQIEIAPVQKLGVIVLTNTNDGDPFRYIDQAFVLLNPAVAKAVAPPDTQTLAAAAWQPDARREAGKFGEVPVQL